MEKTNSWISKESGLILFAAILTFVYAYAVSFRSPIVIDYGVLLDRSWRVFQGQVPARDFFCPTTPLTYFIQALIFKVFDPKVFWMKMYLGLQMAAITAIMGVISWRFLGAKFVTLLVLVLPISIVWSPGVHLMLPWYDLDAVFFSCLVLFFLNFAFNEKNGHSLCLFLAGAAAALSFLSKQNLGGGCIIAAFVFILFQPFGWKAAFRHYVLFSLGVLVPLGIMALYFVNHNALADAWDWMFVRASGRYGEGNLISAMWKSNWIALTGPRNNFLKFAVPFYVLAVGLNFYRWNDIRGKGNLIFGTALYCGIAMWIGILQEQGMRYSVQQCFLGALCGIIVCSVGLFKNFGSSKIITKLFHLGLAAGFFILFFWGAITRWRQAYNPQDIHWTVNHPKLNGMYFRREDVDVVEGLLEFEKTIPKDERVFLMPDPLFFYFATDRLSPVPITHFYVSGWELNEEEQKLIPDRLVQENVKWVIIGKEEFFDTGFLRFGLKETWKEAILKNTAMKSRSDYSNERAFIDQNYAPVDGPDGFWVLRRKKD